MDYIVVCELMIEHVYVQIVAPRRTARKTVKKMVLMDMEDNEEEDEQDEEVGLLHVNICCWL